MRKRILSLLLSLLMMLILLPTQAKAEDSPTLPESETVTGPLEMHTLHYSSRDDGTDPQELFTQYAQALIQNVDSDANAALGGTTGRTQLLYHTDNLPIYDILVKLFREVANGERASTTIGIGTTVTDTDGKVYRADIPFDFSHSNFGDDDLTYILTALLTDLPLEQYWYDQLAGVKCYVFTSEFTGLEHLTFQFTVAKNVRGKDEFTADTSKTSAPKKAVANAQKIVNSFAAKSDYEKLVGYRDTICALTECDFDAMVSATAYQEDNNPWQLIYVFDEDPATKAVSEGYAKAFMYLCERSSFQNYVSCFTVSGALEGIPHMWNIVSIYSKNYLADITAADMGDYGAPELFLVGGTGTINKGYAVSGLQYTYSDAAIQLYKNLNGSILKLSETAYDPTSVPYPRIYGNTRYDTCFQIADTLKQVLGVEKFENIIIASGTNFADALSGSYLAAERNAPILLCSGRNMTTRKRYIRANLQPGGTVYILGGTAAVPQSMETDLDGFAIKRLAGADRYATNLAILEEVGKKSDILVCTGTNFADSLSASATGMPILLIKGTLSNAQKEYLSGKDRHIYIVGGSGAIGYKLENQLHQYDEYNYAERIHGFNRYDTSVNIATRFFFNTDRMVLTYGKNFPDGLCGGPLAHALGCPLVLTAAGGESYAYDYRYEEGIDEGYILGGPAILSEDLIEKILYYPHP